MDSRMILAGRGINPVAAFNDADIASQNALATNQAYAMRDYYRQNGAQVLAGDQNALAGLAQIGPLGAQQAFDARANIQQQQANSFNLEQAKIAAAQQTEAHLAKMSADQIAQEADNLRRLAETAALAKDPMQWDNTFRGTPYEGTWDKRDAVLAILGTQKEVLDRISPPAPKPEDEYGRYVQEETAAGRTPLSRIDFAKAKSPSTVIETGPNGTTVRQGVGAASASPAGITASAMDPKTLVGDIDAILNDPALNKVVGPIEGGGGNNIDEFSMARRAYYGPDGLALIEKVGQLQGKAWLDARQLLKGGGAITDYESRKAEQAMARLSRAKGEEEFRAALTDLRDAISTGLTKLQQGGAPQAATGGIPPVPEGIQPDLWPQLWELMPDSDKALFQ